MTTGKDEILSVGSRLYVTPATTFTTPVILIEIPPHDRIIKGDSISEIEIGFEIPATYLLILEYKNRGVTLIYSNEMEELKEIEFNLRQEDLKNGFISVSKEFFEFDEKHKGYIRE